MVSDNCLSLPLEDGIYAMLWEPRNGGGMNDDASPEEDIKTFFRRVETIEGICVARHR